MAKKKAVKKTVEKSKTVLREHVMCGAGPTPDGMPGSYENWRNNPNYKSYRERFLLVLVRAITNGFTHFISGMSLGFDQLMVECLLELKAKGHEVTIVAAIPCVDHGNNWVSKASRDHYKALLKACDIVYYVSKVPWEQDKDCYKKRDQWMIEKSYCLVALHNGSKGGRTADCITLAQEKNLWVCIVNPTDPSKDGFLKRRKS